MTANVDAMVRDAIRAFKAGKKAEARQLLERATDLDQQHEKAWMWLSAVVDDPEDQRVCLENVLYINPNNANARKGLEYLTQQTGGSAPPSPAPEPPPATPAPEPYAYDEPEPDLDSDEYHVPTSSASAEYGADASLNAAALDDWVAGLNLGGGDSGAAMPPEEPAAPQQAPAFAFDDDLFANAFGADDEDDDSGFTDPTTVAGTGQRAGSDMTSGPFDDAMNADSLLDGFDSDDDFDLDDFGFDSTGADEERFEPSPPTDDLDALLADFPDELASLPDEPAPIMSPEPQQAEQSAAESRRKQRKNRKPSERATAPATEPADFYVDGEDVQVSDPAEYFRAIPEGIRATRLPGAGRGLSLPVVAGFVVLLLLNAGALALLVMNNGT